MDEGTLRMYPSVDDPHGSDSMFYGARHWGAHVAISMIDVWVIPPQWIQQLKSINCKWIPYMPVDSSPPSPAVLANLPLADKLITFSKFGHDELTKNGFNSTMIYEGVDVNKLQPKDQLEARKKLGLPPDIFIWGMIAANKENPPRKAFQQALEAFKMFVEKHPQARLFCHTQQISPASFPIQNFANYIGIGDKILYLDQLQASILATREDIETQYNAIDALLHPSQTEGFGLTIVESQACGKPVVVNRCHSMPELIIDGKTGEMSKVGSRWFTNAGSYWETPDPISIYKAMERVYESLKNNADKVKNDCRQNVLKNFDIDKIFKEKWLPWAEALQDEILPVNLTKPQ